MVLYVHDKVNFFKYENLKEEQRKLYDRPDVRVYQIIVTLLKNMISYSSFINTDMMEKFVLYMALPEKSSPKSCQFHLHQTPGKSRELLILPEGDSEHSRVLRVFFKTWEEIYLNLMRT